MYHYLSENFTYSQAQEAESLPALFLDTNQCAPLKSNPTAEKCFSPDKETESCHDSRFGMTSEPSTENLGEVELMLYAEASPAKTSAWQEEKGGSPESEVDYGQKCREWFAKYDPLTYSWKIRQLWLFEDLDESLATWPKWGIMQSGECFEQAESARYICENEFSFMPTLTKFSATNREISEKEIKRTTSGWLTKIAKTGVEGSMNWSQWMLCQGFLPTPKAADYFMGFPTEWTGLAPVEMRSFQAWLLSHGEP